jgi:transcriptional regulator with XRE-family HTH domain
MSNTLRNETYDRFRTNLIYWRKKNRLSQSALARKLGVPPSYICDLENKRRPGVTLGTVAEIAAALGVSASTLLAVRQNPVSSA